ncbi:MAG: chemotaxis protein CheD [Proteobacteria bacterium]|nr:chemotaxis protein CheD [Pseudomonadota bacterium]
MKIVKDINISRYILEPGDYYVTDKRVVIKTLLGSCVAACLFDPVNRIMGMNHFLLGSEKKGLEGSLITSESGRYGINAMELIINGMLKLGALKKNIKAKAFGGGNVLNFAKDFEAQYNVGDLNSRFIKEFLETEKIPLVASDLGGNRGRVILFHGQDYTVFVRKIGQYDTTKIADRDSSYWKAAKQKKWQLTPEVELWSKKDN